MRDTTGIAPAALMTLIFGTLAAWSVWAADADADADAVDDTPAARVSTAPAIYLYGSADLEKLKQANPGHYARAQQLIADADEICKPGKDEMRYVKYDAKDVSCQAMFVKTSNPPKREIGFTLDDVRYVAVVTLTDATATFHRVPRDGASK